MPLIKKAKALGYETHVFAWKEGAVGAKYADYFYPISIVEKEEILEKCKEIKPDAVLSVASDLATITVNYLTEKLGLTGNSLECTKISTNKSVQCVEKRCLSLIEYVGVDNVSRRCI